MRLHQLKIRNLASLRGEHVVNFEDLQGQDLFAITGETGSGKSTLLNALSLALYGRVYKSVTAADLVTLGERDGQISLYFSVRATSYLATWRMSVRKKDGGLLAKSSPERFFYQLPEDGNEAEARVLNQSPEEVLQLDFQQFCKCVVLNQGEFARFLTATFSERRDILEKLYPSDNIDTVGGLAKLRYQEKFQQVQHLDIRAHTLAESAIFWDVDTAKALEAKRLEEQAEAEAQLKQLRPRAKLLSELLSHAKLFQSALVSREHAQSQLQERTDASNAAMAAWQQQQRKYQALQEEAERERPLLEAHLKEAELLAREEATLRTLLQSAQDQAKRLQQLSERRTQLRQRVDGLREEQKELAAKAVHVSPDRSWQGIEAQRAQDLWSQEAQLKQEEAHALKQLRQLEAEGRETAERLQQLQHERAAQLAHLPADWVELGESERGSKLKAARERERQESLREKQEAQLRLEIAQGEAQRPLLQSQAERAQDRLEQYTWWHSLWELRQHLLKHDASDCPLCQQAIPSGLRQRLTQEWKAEQDSKQLADLNLTKREAEEVSHRLGALDQQLSQLKERLEKLPRPAVGPAHLPRWEEAHLRLVALEQGLKETQTQVERARLQWKQLQVLHSKASESLGLLQRQAQEWRGQVHDQLQVQIPWSAEGIREWLRDFERHRRYQELAREIAQAETQIQQVSTDHAEIQSAHAVLTAELRERETKAQALRSELTRRYGDAGPQGRLKERAEELRGLSQKDQLLHNEYRLKEKELAEVRARLQASGEQLKQLELLFTQEIQRLEDTTGTLTLDIASAHELLAPLSHQLEEKIREQEALLKQKTQELAQLRTQLEADRKLREEQEVIRGQRQRAQNEVERLKRLLDVLGQDDLRTYVLSLVETALIQQTNQELQRLCAGRYEIQHNRRSGKLAPDFYVIDRWRDGNTRKVSTLSGGETFMVSLAMALALAEMTRGKADIDCFFIDEGFGTLDEDSLDDVLEMLQQVQSRGKQIGLITHVKSLSQRLPLNLNLHKDSRGNSSVNLVWN